MLAFGLEVFLQFKGHIEVVLDGALAPSGDEHHLFDAGRHGLFHHVLYERLINEREHLLGRRFGRR